MRSESNARETSFFHEKHPCSGLFLSTGGYTFPSIWDLGVIGRSRWVFVRAQPNTQVIWMIDFWHLVQPIALQHEINFKNSKTLSSDYFIYYFKYVLVLLSNWVCIHLVNSGLVLNIWMIQIHHITLVN